MPQINFNKLYDILVNWRGKKVLELEKSRWNTASSEQLGKELAEEHLEIIKNTLQHKSFNIVKGVTQTDIDESLLAEYNDDSSWNEKREYKDKWSIYE